MPLVAMAQLLEHAEEQAYGIPSFNFNDANQLYAVMAAAARVGAPVIVQASAGARKYASEPVLRHLVAAALESYPDICVALHQDHGASPAVCFSAIRSGFSSVMMDGSLQADGKTVATYDYNVAVTRQVVDCAHAIGVTVEGELGCLGSLETLHSADEDGHGATSALTAEQLLTDPDQARDFVERTRCDALAIAIGTSHGAYKFSRKPTEDILAIDRVQAIKAKLPNTYLVMHGASSVPQELLEEIREFGGNLKPTYGVPLEEIQRAIQHGVRKINIDTDLRLAMTAAVRRYLFCHPEDFDPRAYLKPAREAMQAVCEARYLAFGCQGQAAKIKPLTLEKMAQRYASTSK